MKNHNISIEDFAVRYRKNYDWLYEGGDRISEYEDLVKSFDTFASTHREFVAEFCNHIGDLISSDREAAAFMMTLTDMTDEEENTMDTTTKITGNCRATLINGVMVMESQYLNLDDTPVETTACEQLSIIEPDTESLKARIAELEDENARLEHETIKQSVEIEELQTQAQEAIADMQKAEDEAERLKDASAYAEQLETENESLRARIAELETALAAATQTKPETATTTTETVTTENTTTETEPKTEPAALDMGTTTDEAEAALKTLEGVTVTVKGRKTAMPVIWISGDTKQHKETLKAAGCKWSAKKGAWWYKTATC